MDVLDNNPLFFTTTKLRQRVHLRGKGFYASPTPNQIESSVWGNYP